LPGTTETLSVIQQLIAEGINVNVTPLFDLSRYRQVAEAYLAGLEARVAAGKSVEALASVAGFFLGRIDTLVDPLLEQQIHAGGTEGEMAARLQGKVAIATARLAYQIYQELFTSERFRKLAERGARPQRLLWTRIGIRSPKFGDLMYVESLIGTQTVCALPLATLHAYREQGQPAARLQEEIPEAQHVLQCLPEAGVDLT
jgi:transaldolase